MRACIDLDIANQMGWLLVGVQGCFVMSAASKEHAEYLEFTANP